MKHLPFYLAIVLFFILVSSKKIFKEGANTECKNVPIKQCGKNTYNYCKFAGGGKSNNPITCVPK